MRRSALIFSLRQLADANLSPYLDTSQDLLNRKNQILQKYETDLMEVICERPLKICVFFQGYSKTRRLS
jgi:hypothetical protein